VDELDRCRPDFSIQLLERIKHYFDTPGVSFLVLTNLCQLEASVSAVYGSEIDAGNYLRKFFHLTVDLPRVERDFRGHYDIYAEILLQHYISSDAPVDRGIRFNKCLIESVFRMYSLSLRDMQKCMQMISSQLLWCNSRDFCEYLTPFLAATRIARPDIFDLLQQRKIDFQKLRYEIAIAPGRFEYTLQYARCNHCSPMQVLEMILRHFLGEEIGESIPNDVAHAINLSKQGFAERAEFIPYLCRQLTLFRQ
jgi:hypothetical protein